MAIIADIQTPIVPYHKTQADVALTTSFVEHVFPGAVHNIFLRMDTGSRTLSYSFDGTTVHGIVKDTDTQPFKLYNCRVRSIWLKGSNGGESYRIYAY